MLLCRKIQFAWVAATESAEGGQVDGPPSTSVNASVAATQQNTQGFLQSKKCSFSSDPDQLFGS